MFQALIQALLNGLVAIYNATVGPVLGWVWEVVLWFAGWWAQANVDSVKWVWDLVKGAGEEAVRGMWACVPASLMPACDQGVYWLGVADRYVPVSEGLALLAAMMVFWSAFVVGKYAWRLVPFFH